MRNFLWNPGNGYDKNALERIKTQFNCPKEPMGEAWFNTDNRRIYNFLKEDLGRFSAFDIMEPLEAIASGTSSFGHHEEWNTWFHYLIGQLVPRSHEHHVDYLLEYLITAFITQYPNGSEKVPYRGFEEDALHTIGKCIMDQVCWKNNQINIGHILQPSNNNPNKVWCWWNASGDLSASLFFCIKYLPSNLIEPWFLSVLSIESPHWRSQLIVWLVGAYDILNNIIQNPSEFPENSRPSIDWAWSHCLSGNYTGDHENPAISLLLPEENAQKILLTLRDNMNENMYFEWLQSISYYEYLEKEIAEIPIRFAELYVTN